MIKNLINSGNNTLPHIREKLVKDCEQGNHKQVQKTLEAHTPEERKTMVNGLLLDGCTLLHMASKRYSANGYLLRPNEELIKLLIAQGGDVNAKDRFERTPLHKVCSNQKFEGIDGVMPLIKAGADINAKKNDGQTPLHGACGYANAECAQLLIQHGANINIQDSDGNTPLHYACQAYGGENCIEVLLQYGADATLKNKNGQSAFDVAKIWGIDEDCMELLTKHSTGLQ